MKSYICSSLLIFLLLVFTTPLSAMQPLSEDELQNVSGDGGVVADLDLVFEASRLIYKDGDGCSSDIPNCTGSNNGVLQLGAKISEGGSNNDVFFGDPAGGDDAVSIDGIKINLDGNDLVIDPGDVPGSPTGPDLVVNPFVVGSETSSSNAALQIFDPNINDSLFKLRGRNGGFAVRGRFDLEVTQFRILDLDGFSGASGNVGVVTLAGISFGTGSNPESPFNLGGGAADPITVNADPNTNFGPATGLQGGLVVKVPENRTFGLDIDNINLVDGKTFEARLRNAAVRYPDQGSPTPATLKIGPDRR